MSTDSARPVSDTPEGPQTSTPKMTRDGKPFVITLILGIVGLSILVYGALRAEFIMTAIIGEDRIEKIKEVRRLAKKGIDTIPAVITAPEVAMQEMPVRDGLQTWFRAEDAVESEKGGVAYVPDLSGNAHHITQGRRRWQPALKPDGLNGKPVLSFDGTDDFMELGSFGDSTLVTVVCVWQKTKEGGDPFQRLYSSGSQGMDYQSKGVYYIPKTDNNGVGASPVQITMKRPRKAKDASNFIVGRLNVKSEPPQHFFGDIAEMMVFNRRISNEERDAIRTYLTNKYNL